MDSQQKAFTTPSSRPPQSGGGAKALFPIDSDTHLLDRLNAIYKYRSLAITVFLLVMLAVLVRTYTTTPMYRATTSVLIEDEHGGSVAGFNAAAGNDNNYQDPEAFLRSGGRRGASWPRRSRSDSTWSMYRSSMARDKSEAGSA